MNVIGILRPSRRKWARPSLCLLVLVFVWSWLDAGINLIQYGTTTQPSTTDKGETIAAPPDQWLLICFSADGDRDKRLKATVVCDRGSMTVIYQTSGGTGRLHGRSTDGLTYTGDGNDPEWSDGRFNLTFNEAQDSAHGRWWTPGSVKEARRIGGELSLIKQ